jgi:uncharacterized protein (TIGR00299 family) protein
MSESSGVAFDRIAVFDCFSGIAGDMTLAALIDAGASQDFLKMGLSKLKLPEFCIDTSRVVRGAIEALHVRVQVSEEKTYQPPEMRSIVRAAGLSARVTDGALAAIGWLESGESAAHRTDVPHFHEVGGVDALIDIVGVMLALEDLRIGSVACPVVVVGSGTITKSAHGMIPAAPGPAAAHILQQAGFPMRFVEAGHEMVTPTGAAILAAIATPGPASLVSERHGVGAGTSDPAGRPNALRIFIGRAVRAEADLRRVTVLEANIDDMTAVLLSHARDRLMEEGALDAWTEAIGMKKGRAATKLCALVPEGSEAHFAHVFMSETTTLGVRTTPYSRYEAKRAIHEFETSLGTVRVKTSFWHGTARRSIEWEDVRRIATDTGLPAVEVQRKLEQEFDATELSSG